MESRLTKGGYGSQQNILRRMINYVHEFFVPTSNERKKKRYAQFKNVSLFVVSTLVFFFFEETIARLVSIENSEIHKGHFAGPQPPF